MEKISDELSEDMIEKFTLEDETPFFVEDNIKDTEDFFNFKKNKKEEEDQDGGAEKITNEDLQNEADFDPDEELEVDPKKIDQRWR